MKSSAMYPPHTSQTPSGQAELAARGGRVTLLRRLGLLGAVCALLGLTGGTARAQSAQPPAFLPGAIVAMMPFDGKDTAPPPRKPLSPMQTASDMGDLLAVRPQNKFYKVLSPFQWASLTRLKPRTKGVDMRPTIRLLKASVVIGGWLEATPGPDAPKPYRLTLTLYDSDGQLIGQLGYDVDSPVISSQKFVTQATAFFQMLDQALRIPQQAAAPSYAQAPATSGAPVAAGAAGQAPMQGYYPQGYYPPGYKPQGGVGTAQAPQPYQQPAQPYQQPAAQPYQQASQQPYPPPARAAQQPYQAEQPTFQLEDHEEAPLGQPLVPHAKEANDVLDRRPPWQQALDVRVGYLYNSRGMTNEGSDLAFGRSGASGLLLHLEGYPLAFLKTASAPLAGIGVRLDVQLPFWGEIKQVSAVGGATTGTYAATERRVEFALRWHWNYWNQILRPDFEVEALFGDHPFSTEAKVNIDYLRIPPASYRYLGMAFGGRMFFTRKLGAKLGFTFAKLLNLGLLAASGMDEAGGSTRDVNGFQSYGPGTGWLWRMDLGASYDIWKGLTAGVGFFYEQNKLSFDGQGNIMQRDGRTPVTKASDDYMGLMITVGYVFRPLVR